MTHERVRADREAHGVQQWRPGSPWPVPEAGYQADDRRRVPRPPAPWRDADTRPGHDFGSMSVQASAPVGASSTRGARRSTPSSMGVTSMVEHHRQRISATIRVADPRSDAQPDGRQHGAPLVVGRWHDGRRGTTPVEVPIDGLVQSPAAGIEEPAEGQSVRLPDIRIGSSVSETDALASTLAYSPTVAQAPGQPADSFGETSPYDFSLSGITVTRAAGAFTVGATVDNPITFQIRTTTGPDGQVDIDSDSDPDITSGNYDTVVRDLTPDMSDLKGRPPRNEFFAKDITLVHERFHATDGQAHARTGVSLAQAWLNGQTAANVAAVNALVNQVPARVIATRRAAMTYPGREERAYTDGVPLYTRRATAIQAKGASGQYPMSRGKKVAIGVGAGVIAGAAIGSFLGPVGAGIGAGVGAVAGLIGGLLL